jgi:Flp pilus assembly protein CpaB
VSSRRTAILIGAIAVGIVAVLLIVSYVNSIKAQVDADNETVSVFIAKNDIKRGTLGNVAVADGSIDAATIPRKFYPSTAIQSTDAVSKKVALFDIASGTVIVNGMFVDPSTTQISFRERLGSPKHVAISISVDQVKGVGGFLVPGDEVNMMIYQDNSSIVGALNSQPGAAKSQLLPEFNLKPEASESYIGAGGRQWIIFPKTARYLYQKVQVLAVGSNQLLGPGEQASDAAKSGGSTTQTQSDNSLITLSVPPLAAQWIATGQVIDNGFYLSLVAQGYDPTPLQPLPIVVDQLPGEQQGVLTPYAGEAG